ncbi:Lysine-specific histone demethylase 1B [Anabarilius grahami]|uniref:Lysine-specific histone demethylase 1B n=1 Tax=Anabarilius grahami TaxID=495550 RepID=A0A3N0XCZ3_ANAGA|nr:Lysine-specific histone demethylase 1B [Anabarilius grahami]
MSDLCSSAAGVYRGRAAVAMTRRKAAETGEDDDQSEKKFRKCEKSGCPATYPVCFASASERCARNGYTSRWYHLSCGEHFCNECFDHYYRSHKDGYETFSSWKRVWTSNGKSEPSLKAFMADQQLPYWVQCTKADCRKWRQLSKETQLTAALASSYRCGMKLNSVKVRTRHSPSRRGACADPSRVCAFVLQIEGCDACSQPEDVHKHMFLVLLCCEMSDHVCECSSLIGQVVSSLNDDVVVDQRVLGVADSWWHSMLILPPLFKDSPASPFLSAYYPDCVGMSPSAAPGNQRPEQRRAAPPHIPGLSSYFQPFYQPNECGKALCVRPDMMELDELYEFPEFSRDPTMYLALRNLVLAAWHRDCKEVLTPQKCAPHVIVRGLVRIRCVQELERVLYFMTRKGLINTGALQIKWPLLPESQHNKVLVIGAGAAGLAAARQLQNFGMQEGGRVTDPALDKRMDFHFNAVLDAVSDWRKDKSQSQDAPLGEKIQEVYKTFLQESGLHFTELEEKVLHFHLSNLEYACGSTLDQVSARSWDHNECFAQFSGDHTLFTDGYSSVLHNLAQGLDIRLNTAVLVTVPLALLQKNVISFTPPLPERKLKAIHSLGAGVIEKVALQFPTRFWEGKIQGADYFGHVPPCPEKRGLFSVFYDMRPQGEECVLMTVITGEALALVRDLQDTQVVDLCMSVLRELFQEQDVPDPVKYFVTHWSKDSWSQMSYSFVKTGGSGEAYDIIAEDLQGKLFFAGEATNRHFPQTVTGAYLSGVREASKIAAL